MSLGINFAQIDITYVIKTVLLQLYYFQENKIPQANQPGSPA